MAERPNAKLLKSFGMLSPRGFKSHSLRRSLPQLALTRRSDRARQFFVSPKEQSAGLNE
jgi:hypothetical protein